MKLYYIPGTSSLASHIVLRESGVFFEIESVDSVKKETETGEDFTVINPNGCVPALSLVNGEVLTESPAILQYIADQNPGSDLVPESGTIERTRLHEYLNYISSELHTSFLPLFSSYSSVNEKKIAKENVEKKMNYFESIFSDGRNYLVGDKYSVSDAYLFVVCRWTKSTGIDMENWPYLDSFSKRIADRKNVKDALQAEGLLN